MRHVSAVGALCLTLFVGCGRSASPEATPEVVTSTPQAAAPQPPPPPPLYDASGNLLPSDQTVAWLELPRGLTKLPVSSGTFHAYVAKDIPSDRIQAFFGARLIAGEVTKLGEQGIRLSRGIPPSGSKPKQSVIDVTIVPGENPGETSVRIVENVYLPPAPKFSANDARVLMKQERKQAE